MNADAKLATRENVSTPSAPFSVMAVPEARRITHASSAMHAYAADVAASRTARRLGFPRTSSSISRSTAATNVPTRPPASAVPSRRSSPASHDCR